MLLIENMQFNNTGCKVKIQFDNTNSANSNISLLISKNVLCDLLATHSSQKHCLQTHSTTLNNTGSAYLYILLTFP